MAPLYRDRRGIHLRQERCTRIGKGQGPEGEAEVPKLTLPAGEVLPRPPLDAFKAVVATFPLHSGLGVDKFPIRKLLLLTDGALEPLLDILMMMEIIGCLPPQHQVVL